MKILTKSSLTLATIVALVIASSLSVASETTTPDPEPDPSSVCSTLEPTVCPGANIGTWPWCNDGPAGCCWGKTVTYRCSDGHTQDYEFRYLGSQKICNTTLAQCQSLTAIDPQDPETPTEL